MAVLGADGKLLDEKRADYFPQVWDGNIALDGRSGHSQRCGGGTAAVVITLDASI